MTFEQAEKRVKAAKVDGLIPEREIHRLFDIASRSTLAAEIGSYVGFSASYVGLAMANRGGNYFCIDPYVRSPWYNVMNTTDAARLENALATFMAKMHALDLTNVCFPVAGYSFSKRVFDSVPSGLDFLFIDGDHETCGVASDLVAWMPKVKPEGLIILHDANWPGPKEVLAWAIQRDLIRLVEMIDTLAVCRKGTRA